MKKKIKFEGCRCEYKEKEWEVDLTGETYNENKDLFTCCQCASWDKYKDFNKKKLKGAKDLGEVGHTTDYFIIYGAKSTEIKEGQQKCLDCSTIDYVSDSFCPSCGSKNVECKYNGIHFTVEECKDCKKVDDVKYHNLSEEASKKQKRIAEQNWKEVGEYCSCEKKKKKNRESQSGKPTNWNPWIIGGIGIVAVIGVIIYFWVKSKPKEEDI